MPDNDRTEQNPTRQYATFMVLTDSIEAVLSDRGCAICSILLAYSGSVSVVRVCSNALQCSDEALDNH